LIAVSLAAKSGNRETWLSMAFGHVILVGKVVIA